MPREFLFVLKGLAAKHHLRSAWTSPQIEQQLRSQNARPSASDRYKVVFHIIEGRDCPALVIKPIRALEHVVVTVQVGRAHVTRRRVLHYTRKRYSYGGPQGEPLAARKAFPNAGPFGYRVPDTLRCFSSCSGSRIPLVTHFALVCRLGPATPIGREQLRPNITAI
jgi:hypothetical protein